MVQEKWWAPQKLTPQVVGTPKHTPQSPLPPTSILLPLTSPDPLSLPGSLRTSWGLRKAWEPLEALGLQSDSEALLPLLPLTPHPFSLPLTPSHPLSLPRPPWVSVTFLGPQEALGAFRSLRQLWSSVRLRGLAFLLPFTSLTPSRSPEPPWASLGPWDLPGASGSLQKPLAALVFSQTQGPCFPCSPSPPSLPLAPSRSPEPPWASLGPWDLPWASGSLGSLQKSSAAFGLQSDSGALLPLLPLTPLTLSCPLSLPGSLGPS